MITTADRKFIEALNEQIKFGDFEFRLDDLIRLNRIIGDTNLYTIFSDYGDNNNVKLKCSPAIIMRKIKQATRYLDPEVYNNKRTEEEDFNYGKIEELFDTNKLEAVKEIDLVICFRSRVLAESIIRSLIGMLTYSDDNDQCNKLVFHVLKRELESPHAGRRSAAASSLGTFPGEHVQRLLRTRYHEESNRMVRATLRAHIKDMNAF